MKKVIVVLIFSTLSFSTFANDGLYAGAHWGGYIFEESINYAGTTTLETEGITLGLQLGYNLHELLDVEFRLGTQAGESQEDVNILGENEEITLTVDSYYSLFLRPRVQYGYGLLYGLVGYSQISGEAKFREFEVTADTESNGLSYGVGAGFIADSGMTLSVEYVSILDEGAVTIAGVNLVISGPL